MLTTANCKEAMSGSLTIKDFDASTVGEMLKFCYTGDLKEDGVPRIIELILLVSLKYFTPFMFQRKICTFILSYGASRVSVKGKKFKT